MAHRFITKSFITNATALDNTQTDGRGVDSLSKQGKPHSKGGIDINVEGGEYVIKKNSVNASTEPYLEYINRHGKLPISIDARKRRK